MINTDELKRNNWIEEQILGYVQVYGVTKDYVKIISKGMKANGELYDDILEMPAREFVPIPLTPDIVTKCNFHKDKAGDWEHQIDPTLYLKLIFSMDGYAYPHYIESSGDEYKVMGIARINSLHQLQNLLYCLTGQELNYNLK